MSAHAGGIENQGSIEGKCSAGGSNRAARVHRSLRKQASILTLAAIVFASAAHAEFGEGEGPMSFDSVTVSEDGIMPIPQDPLDGGGEYGWSQSSGEATDGEVYAAAAPLPPFQPHWDLAVDALMLWQGNAQNLPLFLDSTGGTALNSQDLQTQMGAGARVGLIRYVGDCHAIEGNYFQARPFNAIGNTPATGGPYELTNMGDLVFNDIDSATVTSSGWIQSAEVNWRKCVGYSPITWIAGFRWVELNSTTNVDYAFTNPDPFGAGSVNTASGNNLYGGQVGGDMRLWNAGGRWRVNGIGKAGIFYNTASFQRSTAGFVYADGTPFPLGSVNATADQTSFFGEVGLNSTWWITEWLAWRAGYTVMWAAGVAVATDQLPLNNFGDGTASINTNGSVLLHGVTTGIEARW